MICADAEEKEFEFLARQAGCSADEARFALRLFEELFPYPSSGGWHYDAYELSRLKLMPVPLRGAGLVMREALYGGDWGDLATDLQRQVAGQNEMKRAEVWAQRIPV